VHLLKVKRKQLFLKNQGLEQNPVNQKKTNLYKNVLKHIKKIGYIINPLIVIAVGDKYSVLYGNNRYLAGVELGLKEFPIKIINKDNPETIMNAAKNYEQIDLNDKI
jgi:ParB-like chromosome segregation protein Spo0J